MKSVASLIGLLTLGATATPKDDPFAGRVQGVTQTCIDGPDRSNMRIIDDRTIIYHSVGRRLWRNDLPERCPGLDRDPLLIVEQFGAQLCANDRVRVQDRLSSVPGPYCRLGKFTAWDKLAK